MFRMIDKCNVYLCSQSESACSMDLATAMSGGYAASGIRDASVDKQLWPCEHSPIRDIRKASLF